MEYNDKFKESIIKLRELIDNNEKYETIQLSLFNYAQILKIPVNQLLLMVFNREYITDLVYNDVVEYDKKINILESQLNNLREKRKLATSCICALHGHVYSEYDDEKYFCPVCGEYLELERSNLVLAKTNANSLSKTFYSLNDKNGK